MQLETEYIEYGIQLSLAVIGASMAYFVDPSRPTTMASLLLMPVLYGYTAYISHEGFSHSSLMSLPALIFVITGGLTALIAVFYSIGNVLVSVFSHGTQFKDFYGSTSLPLLMLGLLAGTSVFVYGSISPGFQEDLTQQTGEKVGEFSEDILNDMDIVEGQKQSQLRLVNSTSRLAVSLTRQKVLSEVESTPELQESFATAEENVTRQVYNRTAQRFDRADVDMSGIMQEAITDRFRGMSFVLVIPFVAGIFYVMQPVIGLLTAIFGKLSLLLDG